MTNIYTINSDKRSINFAPKNVVEEILQNVHTIISTMQFSVPLFREFGTSAGYLDAPHVVAQSKYLAEIIEIVERYEPRAIVEEVLFHHDEEDGRMYPVVKIRIQEGVV